MEKGGKSGGRVSQRRAEPLRPIPCLGLAGDNSEKSFFDRSFCLHLWNRAALKSLVVPGGILLAGVAALLYSGWLTLALPALSFLYFCALAGGMLLAWRFHSSRTFFSLAVLFLAGQALSLSGAGSVPGSAGSIALQAVAFLVPLNFLLIATMHERGFTVSSMAPVGLFLFVQAVVVTVLCRADEGLHSLPARAHHAAATVSLPGYALLAFAGVGLFLLVRCLLTRQPVDSALLWSLTAYFLALHFISSIRASAVYSAAAACILATSIIENSYLLAYHDELTTLPSRRAFNDALMRLQEPYSIAMVDIDHFKRFNDTYGHDTGDQVLRLVACSLARVTGGGDAYRCGGEEFAILFSGKTTAEVVEHLEQLRVTIEGSEFRMRSADRRQIPRGPDRRNPRARSRTRKGDAIRHLAQEKSQAPLSVTISIGVATSTKENPHPDLVLQAADNALYRAKDNGRNRVETAAPPRRTRNKAEGIA
jgi:diguanylate cyclase (GGDEF)-like protein